MFRKPVSFIMVLMLSTMPVLTLAQQPEDTPQAVADATADADKTNH